MTCVVDKPFTQYSRRLKMVKKISLSVVMMIFVTVSCFAGEKLDTYYPKFEICLSALQTTFVIGSGTYRVEMNYKHLLNTMEDMDNESVRMVASIAIEWSHEAEFPEFDKIFTESGKLELVKAIQTAQARAILKAAEAILCKDRVWL